MPRQLKVHPFADIYPMLSAEELMSLAASIKARGLDKPLVIDHAEEWLVDGRNRAKACEIAGVEPSYVRLPEGTDLVAYILDANNERRHLNAGQRAISTAIAYPKAERGRGKIDPGGKAAESSGFTPRLLRDAREIVAHRDLADRVMAGALPFDHALAEARWRMANAERTAEILRRLQFEAPDLAAEVSAGERSLYSALKAEERRAAERALARRTVRAEERRYIASQVAHLKGLVATWREGCLADERFRAALIAEMGIDPEDLDRWLGWLGEFDRLVRADFAGGQEQKTISLKLH